MADAANEIADIAERIVKRKPQVREAALAQTGGDVGSAHLARPVSHRGPAGDRLRAPRRPRRGAEAPRRGLGDRKINILSLVAEGGAGKSALVNEWLKRMQADNYRGAGVVLGWSFYSQGTKERATSADAFLDWAVDKLGVKTATNSAVAKGEAIAEAMMRRRALLVLDGVEPLQHGPDGKRAN